MWSLLTAMVVGLGGQWEAHDKEHRPQPRPHGGQRPRRRVTRQRVVRNEVRRAGDGAADEDGDDDG